MIAGESIPIEFGGGDRLWIKGQVEVDVNLGSEHFTANAYVIPTASFEGVLGMDLFSKMDIEGLNFNPPPP